FLHLAVQNYRVTLSDSSLNRLILSQFDYDHIAGVDELLEGLVVDFAVIPYISPIERLIIAVGNSGVESWVYEFLIDPVRYLSEVEQVRKSVIIGGAEEERSDDRPRDSEEPDSIRFPRIDLTSFEMPGDLKTKRMIQEDGPGWYDYLGKKVFVKNHSGFLNASGVW